MLREFKNYIDQLWDKLAEHIKADSEFQQHCQCLKHYNLPYHRLHIGPASFIRNCSKCQQQKRLRFFKSRDKRTSDRVRSSCISRKFCDPDTHLERRLARDRHINPLDTVCREHDIIYSRSKDLTKRHVADKILAEEAWKRIIAKDSTLGERAAATTIGQL